jgi:hypothetical protein
MVTFEEFRKAFEKAEEDIKYAELSIGSIESIEDGDCAPGANPRGIVVPSINELRYAAKHISDALAVGISDKDREIQIDKAIRHCVRARFDALRATIIFLSQHFHHFSQDYSLSNLPDGVRNRQNEIREKLVDVFKKISRIQTQTTDEECDFLRVKIQELHGFYLEVEKQRDVFNQILYETRKHDRTSTILWVVGLIISALFGLIVGTFF